ncbi:MAG: S9 family peptidase [Acidobacteriaceae bacterium]|nr:S9 family peptidase [Acidobacteriaceae bacterium]
MLLRPGARSHLRLFLFAVASASAAVAGPSPALQNLLHQIFVEHAYEGKGPPQFDWFEDGAAYTALEKSVDVPDGQDIVRYETKSGAHQVLVSARTLIAGGEKKALNIEGYQFAKNKLRLLIFTNAKPVWRQHTRGDYWLLDLHTKTLEKLGGGGEPSSMQFAKFSPDGTQVAFVRANDLFVQDLARFAVRQLTHDGSHTIINGTSDWVYEEELDVRDGFRWSPDGRRIAFWHFDSSGVGEYPLIDYTDSVYPTIRMIPYPKAGTTNSAVSVGVVDIASDEMKWMAVPGDPRNNYIARVEWAGNSNELAIEQLNRLQNTANLLIADASTGKTTQIFRDEGKAWVDLNEIRPMGQDFVWLSERDGWRHAYLVHRDGSTPKLLTRGNFDVIGMAGALEKQHAIYFTASPSNATQCYLYRAEATEPGPPRRITPESEPGFHFYGLSPDGKWALHRFSRFDDPWRFELIHLPDHETVHLFSDNSEAREKVKPLLANKSEFFQVEIGAGVTLDGWMIRPKDFDSSRKYPVLVNVYGEPAGQTVVDRWGGSAQLFHRALAQAGYIIVSFDNRGTPAPKGREWRKIVYGSIGPLATEDQTKAIKKLCEERPYLDSSRIAVWGRSGGGTDTLNLMFRSPDVYKVGMAVAPVPDQRLYDTIYQERYMGLPQNNPDGYKRGSAINFACGLTGHLLLVHGTGDDNVHFQGSQMLINKLVECGKQFSFMEYPNRTHAISEGPGTTIHLFTLLSSYLEDNLAPTPIAR